MMNSPGLAAVVWLLDPRDCPFVLGCEGGGTVVAVGPDDGSASDGPSVGDRVTYYCEGSYAEYSAVPAGVAAAVPDELAMGDAVALTVQGLTAHYLTRSTVELTAEHDIIVTAAAGGTGKLVVQMAKMAGARVLGLVSSEHKAAVAMEHGCDETLIYRCPDGGGNVDYSAAAKEFSRTGQGVDVCYDSVGKATAAFSLASLRPRGHCVFYGNASGAPDPIACVSLSFASLTHSTIQRPVIHLSLLELLPSAACDWLKASLADRVRGMPCRPLDLAVAGSLYITRPLLNHYVLSREELNWRAAVTISRIHWLPLK
jgi:NADPH2:quinone reductase